MDETIKLNTEERMLRAFLDLIILRILKQQPMTAYQIDNIIMDKYHSRISPSVTYTKLAAMERKELIEGYLNHGKTYSLTEKGKQLLDKKTAIIKEIHKNAITLFEN